MKICEGCRRHVREERCPFCGGTDQKTIARRSVPLSGVSRAKILAGAAALGATAGLVDLGCSAGTGTGNEVDSGVEEDAKGDSQTVTDAGKDTSVTDAETFDSSLAAYGGPPQDSGFGGPLYGAAP